MFSGLKSMANTPMEAENSGAHEGEASYPFSLSFTLDNDTLEKAGLDVNDPDCKVGNYVEMRILAELVGMHKADTGDGEKTTLNFQCTHLCVEDGDDDEDDQDGDSSY